MCGHFSFPHWVLVDRNVVCFPTTWLKLWCIDPRSWIGQASYLQETLWGMKLLGPRRCACSLLTHAAHGTTERLVALMLIQAEHLSHSSGALPVHFAESGSALVPEHLRQWSVLNHLSFVPLCTSALPTQNLISADQHSPVPALLHRPLADSLLPRACPSGAPGSYPMWDQLLLYGLSRAHHPFQKLQWPHVKGGLCIRVDRPLFIIPKCSGNVPEVFVFPSQTAHGRRGRSLSCVFIILPCGTKEPFLISHIRGATSATEYVQNSSMHVKVQSCLQFLWYISQWEIGSLNLIRPEVTQIFLFSDRCLGNKTMTS